MKHEIYFGVDLDCDGDRIDYFEKAEALGMIKASALRKFSGYTMIATEGGWTDPTGKVVEEFGRLLVVFGGTDDDLKGLATTIKFALRQSSVLVISTPATVQNL